MHRSQSTSREGSSRPHRRVVRHPGTPPRASSPASPSPSPSPPPRETFSLRTNPGPARVPYASRSSRACAAPRAPRPRKTHRGRRAGTPRTRRRPARGARRVRFRTRLRTVNPSRPRNSQTPPRPRLARTPPRPARLGPDSGVSARSRDRRRRRRTRPRRRPGRLSAFGFRLPARARRARRDRSWRGSPLGSPRGIRAGACASREPNRHPRTGTTRA